MEAKGLNDSKTKMMFGGKYTKAAVEHVKYPCGAAVKVSAVTQSYAQHVVDVYISNVVVLKEVFKRFSILSAVYVRLAILSKII